MTVPTITALPEIPAYSDANFETKAPAVLSALRNTFVAEMNAAIAAINSYDYGAAVNVSKVVGLTAGRIPYGAGTGALANSANFTFESNRLNLQNDSGAQLRLTDSTGNYADFEADGEGNLKITSATGLILEKGIYRRYKLLTGVGKLLRLPVTSQGSANRSHYIKIVGMEAAANNNQPRPFSVEFAFGSLTTLVNLASVIHSGVDSVTVDGMNILITLSIARSTAAKMYIEYMSDAASLLLFDSMTLGTAP